MNDTWKDCYKRPMPCPPNSLIDVITCDASLLEEMSASSCSWECDYGCCVEKWRFSKENISMNDFEWSEAYKAGREAGWSEAIAWFASGKMPADGMPVGISVRSGKIAVDAPHR